VNSQQFALALSRFASETAVPLSVHVKVDTGMGRFGSRPNEVVALAEAIRSLPSLEVEGIFTHFASADDPDRSFTQQQFELFLHTCERLPWIPIRHASASAATIDLPEMALDMVRPGIALYGYAQSASREPSGLRPVMSFKSRLVRIQEMAAGETVSYGRTWTATRPTPVGLVMAGYADGLPRLLSNRGSALVRGKRVPIIGRVCMDQCIVDLSSVPDAEVEDEVVLIGTQGDESITADDVAELAGTISYEMLTGIAARVPRLMVRGDRVTRVLTLTNEAG
jgi:alanine racemase